MNAKNISPLEAHIGYWMRFVSNRVSEEFRRAVEACGVSVTEWVALRILYGQKDATHGALTQALGMTKGAVSKLIVRLEERKLVVRDVGLADARQVMLNLTTAGRDLVPRLAQIADENDRQFFGHLTAEQQAELRELLERIVRLQQLTEVPVH